MLKYLEDSEELKVGVTELQECLEGLRCSKWLSRRGIKRIKRFLKCAPPRNMSKWPDWEEARRMEGQIEEKFSRRGREAPSEGSEETLKSEKESDPGGIR